MDSRKVGMGAFLGFLLAVSLLNAGYFLLTDVAFFNKTAFQCVEITHVIPVQQNKDRRYRINFVTPASQLRTEILRQKPGFAVGDTVMAQQASNILGDVRHFFGKPCSRKASRKPPDQAFRLGLLTRR